MSVKVYPGNTRGGADHGWLKTKFSFSFAEYYDPERMGFGALRVINDDWIAPRAGFPTHAHQNMEIITLPLTGSLAHKDDTGAKGIITPNMVQVMSAGTGVLHSEFNGSDTEPVQLFQIWIEPDTYHVKPRYQESHYNYKGEVTESVLLVGPEGESDVWIHQQAYIHRINVLPGEEYSYEIKQPKNGVFILLIDGKGIVQNHELSERDALEINGEPTITFQAQEKMDILSIQVPFSHS